MTELQEANMGFINAWRLMMERIPTGKFETVNGFAAALGALPTPFLNVFFPTSPTPSNGELSARLDGIRERIGNFPHPWFLTLCDEWTPETREEVCLKLGWVPAMKLYAMATDEVAPAQRALPDLEYRRVSDLETANLVAQINAAAYAMPPEMAETFVMPDLWQEDVFGYIGFVEGEPVSCAATLVIGDLLYVAWVATLPESQRKGFADAVMRKSVEEASRATGLKRSLLHATEAGAPVYARMSYRQTAGFTLFQPASD